MRRERVSAMRKPNRSRIIFILAAAGLIFAGAIPLAAEKFTGRILTGGTANIAPVLNCKVSIEKYTNPEEILELVKILNEKGYEPFMKAFRETNKGMFQVTGGRGLNVTIHATNSVTTDKGRRVQLFSERQSWDVDIRQRMSGQYLFMVIELDIDAEGRGTGRIYPAAEIQFNSEGKIEMKSYDIAPKVIFGLRRTT
jgi:hypothetical protein